MASSSIPAKEAECEGMTVPNWLDLPRDITANILQRLNGNTMEIVKSVCLVCPLWWNIFKDPVMWRTIYMIDDYTSVFDLDLVSFYAIKRSCGYLEEIEIEYPATDGLLQCIAVNSSNLRRLQLDLCDRLWLSDRGFSEAVRQLPMLEEVWISDCHLSKDSLEVLGQSCPLLKSLTFERPLLGLKTYGPVDGDAFVIAETMSGLRHLSIPRNQLTNVGLLAILDGCPLLESLNIVGCDKLQMCENLKKRCQEQIKNLLLCYSYTSKFQDSYDEHYLSDRNIFDEYEYLDYISDDIDDSVIGLNDEEMDFLRF